MSSTLQEILNQTEQYSQLSEEPSFTLTDILEEPLDEDLIDDNQIQDQDMQGFFQDQSEQSPQQQTLTSSKLYQFPSLSQQNSFNQTSPPQNHNLQESPHSPTIENNKLISQSKVISSRSIKIDSQKMQETEVQEIQAHEKLHKMPLLPKQEIENMSFVMLKNVTNLFQDPNNTSVGIPTSISATGNRFLALGTSMGNIVIFQIGVKGNKILGTPQQRKFGYVTSLSISRDNKYLVAGHESGLVTLWDLYYFSLVKQEMNSRSKILQVLFCSQTSEHFISNDVEGNTYIYTIEKYIWTNLKCNKLLQKSVFPFYDIRYHELQSGSSMLGLCTLEYILLISIKPKITVIGKLIRPDGIGVNYLPNIQLGRCLIEGVGYRDNILPMYDVLLASWGKTIFLYKLVPGSNSILTVQQLLVYEHPTVVYNIQFLSQNIFITLDKHQIFRTIRIDISIPSPLQNIHEIQQLQNTSNHSSSEVVTINFPSSTSKQPLITCNVIHSKQMNEEVIYQRLLKNKEQKYIKSFTNTLVNCTFNPQHKEIFFIAKNSVYRARLQKWTTFLSSIVNEQNNLIMAMKIALELKNQKLNIFSQKVQITGKKAEKSMNMFCEVGKIFVEQGLKNVKQNNIERTKNRQRAQMQVKQIAIELKQLYQYAIEYFIELKCEKYLFQTIYAKIIKNLPSFQYWQLFIQSLKPFILAQKLTRIPSIQVFKEILQYFSENKSNSPQLHNMKLIDEMITNLQSESLHYENAVSILAQNKLYKGLAYICSVNKDFISPCNKLLMKMNEASQNRLQNAQKDYFQILQLYLTKLINGFYINDKRVPSRIYDTHVLRDVSLWLSFEDTLWYFIKGGQIKEGIQTQQVKFMNQVKEKSQKVILSYKMRTLLIWVSKLFQQTGKLKQKGNFHELVQHLIQALQSIENKELMKKSTQSLSIRNNVQVLKSQMSLLMIISGKYMDLRESELGFILKTLYLQKVRENKFLSAYQNLTQIQLTDKLTFIKRYFEPLQLIGMQENIDSQKTVFEQVCQTENDWCKYLYNLLVSSITARKNKQSQTLKIKQKSSQLKLNTNDKQISQAQKQLKSSVQNEKAVNIQQTETKSLQLQQNSLRFSQSSSKSGKLNQSKKLIQSLFSPLPLHTLQIPEQSSLIKRRKQMTRQIYKLNLTPFSLKNHLWQTVKDKQNKQVLDKNSNNYILVDFVLKNFSFQEIDSHIQSLIKINSQLVIVYILQHYEFQIVDKKIDLIQDEEVKYFVVRRILKIIRQIKKSPIKSNYFQQTNNRFTTQKEEQSNDSLFRVWGNKHSSYAKKIQSKNSQGKFSVLQKITQSNLSCQIMMFYLTCLAKYKKQKRVYSQLKVFMSDYTTFLQKVLQLMKKFQLHSCIGLIYQQMNDLEHAFQFYQMVYNQRMEINVKKLVMVQHCHGRFLRQIFNQMLQISQKINSNHQWIKLLQAVLQPLIQQNKFIRRKNEQVIDLIQKVYTANPNHTFIQQFGEVIEMTLLQVSSHIPTEEISFVFSQYSELMNKTFMLNCLKSTMHTYSKSIFIYETSNSMVINDQANQFEKIYQDNKIKGMNCMPICEHCSNLIEMRDKVVIYKCSHIYHKKCLLADQQKCIKCVLIEVGENDGHSHPVGELQDLKFQKKQSSIKGMESNQKIEIEGMDEVEEKMEQGDKQSEKINKVYRCLAFDEFLQRDETKFDQFRKDYDVYLSKYE